MLVSAHLTLLPTSFSFNFHPGKHTSRIMSGLPPLTELDVDKENGTG